MSTKYSDHRQWQSAPHRRRCAVVAAASGHIVDDWEAMTAACVSDQRTDPVETISAELIPLCAALRLIGRRGAAILKTRRHGWAGRPLWLWGVRSEVQRVPHGNVLILGTWNYPLLLVGVQAAQALAAGNRVQIKPAAGAEQVTSLLVQAFVRAGVPADALQQLDSSTEAAIEAISSGVDLIVLTGSAGTGRQVLKRAAESLTPTIMELSGCDAAVVMPGGDLQRVADAVTFGVRFNAGATCIAPRRLIVEDRTADELAREIGQRFQDVDELVVRDVARDHLLASVDEALAAGAVDVLGHYDRQCICDGGEMKPLLLDRVGVDFAIASADVFAPVTSIIRVAKIDDAVGIINRCRYRLAASVFGPTDAAQRLAEQLSVGFVCVNDLIVPTADPRLPFGGRGDSGFGVTRGVEGLLAMTTPRVISRRYGKFLLHLRRRQTTDAQMLTGLLQLLHGRSLRKRWQGLLKVIGK